MSTKEPIKPCTVAQLPSMPYQARPFLSIPAFPRLGRKISITRLNARKLGRNKMTAIEIRPTGNYVKQWMVGSHTDPDKEYKVSQTEDGNWKCGCPRWIFGKPRKDCKHILGLKGEEPVDQVRTFGRVVSKEPVYLAPKP